MYTRVYEIICAYEYSGEISNWRATILWMYTYIYVNTYIYLYLHVYIRICIHVQRRTVSWRGTTLLMYTYMCMDMYMHVYSCIYIYMHIYMHTPERCQVGARCTWAAWSSTRCHTTLFVYTCMYI